MTDRDLAILNSLVTYAEENIPGGLNSSERDVVLLVNRWAIDGVPVRQICPHCGVPAPRGEGRVPWLESHINNPFHRGWWTVKNLLRW